MSIKSGSTLEIEPFHVMSVLAKAKEMEAQGKDVIHLEVGEPDFSTPDPMIEAAISIMKTGNIGYTAAGGIQELRETISTYYLNQFQLDIGAERIFITPGASGALQLAMKASLNEGQSLLLTEPGYPCNRNIATVLGIDSDICQLDAQNGYQPTVQQLQKSATDNTGTLLLASPGNPTGTVIDAEHLSQINELCLQNNWHLIMDEIYSGLIYDDHKQTTILTQNPDAWVIQSFSKYFQMTGWRLGWLIVPEGFEGIVNRLAQNLFLSAPTIAQYAALRAFEPGVLAQIEERRQVLDSRRQYMKSALVELGFKLAAEPDGAFYIYVDASEFTEDSLSFCSTILDETCVAIAPGVDFGGLNASTTVRFAYTQDLSRIKEAMGRIALFISNLTKQGS